MIRGLSVDESRVRQATGVSADGVLPIQCPPRTCPSYAKPRARPSSALLTTSSCVALSTESTIRRCRYPYYPQTSSARYSRTSTTTTSPFLARIRLVVSAKSAGTPGPRPHTKVHARVEELPFRYASRCRHARGSVEMYGRRRRDSIGAGSSVQAAQLVVAPLVRGGPLQR